MEISYCHRMFSITMLCYIRSCSLITVVEFASIFTSRFSDPNLKQVDLRDRPMKSSFLTKSILEPPWRTSNFTAELKIALDFANINVTIHGSQNESEARGYPESWHEAMKPELSSRVCSFDCGRNIAHLPRTKSKRALSLIHTIAFCNCVIGARCCKLRSKCQSTTFTMCMYNILDATNGKRKGEEEYKVTLTISK